MSLLESRYDKGFPEMYEINFQHEFPNRCRLIGSSKYKSNPYLNPQNLNMCKFFLYWYCIDFTDHRYMYTHTAPGMCDLEWVLPVTGVPAPPPDKPATSWHPLCWSREECLPSWRIFQALYRECIYLLLGHNWKELLHGSGKWTQRINARFSTSMKCFQQCAIVYSFLHLYRSPLVWNIAYFENPQPQSVIFFALE